MITIPSPLADAIVAADEAHEAWYAASLTGDRILTRQKLIESEKATIRRRDLTPAR
jgi:hypothetical protein